MAAKKEMRMLTADNEHTVVAMCCREIPHGVAEDEHRLLAMTATQYLREDLEKNEMPMGCSAKVAKKHIERAMARTKERMNAERQDPACGFGFIAIFSFISAMFTIFNALKSWFGGA